MIIYVSFAYALIAAVVFGLHAYWAYSVKSEMFIATSGFINLIKKPLLGQNPRRALELCQRGPSAPICHWVDRLITYRELVEKREHILENINEEVKGLVKRFVFFSQDTIFFYASYLALWGAFMVFGGVYNTHVILVMLGSFVSTLLFGLVRLSYLRVLQRHFARAPDALKELHEWMQQM